jgi:hypothetical protein
MSHWDDARLREIQRTLRWLKRGDLERIEGYLHCGITFDDFIGATRVADLPGAALKYVRCLGLYSPILAAKYLGELLPPTAMSSLLAVVDHLVGELSEVWRLPKHLLNACDLETIESLIGRPLTAEDFLPATSIEALPPRTREVAQKIAARQPIVAVWYLIELLPPEHIVAGDAKVFVSKAFREARDSSTKRDETN